MTFYVLPVTEYRKDPLPNWDVVSGSYFSLSEQQLVVYIVRAMLTRRAHSAARHYLTASVAFTLDFMLDRTRAPDFVVDMRNMGLLRDFSMTGRTGELAQGIAYAYAVHATGSVVCDFVDWSKANYPSHILSKMPDFAVLSLIHNRVDVMEAKGTMKNIHRKPMKRALEQAKLTGHPGVTQGFGAVVAFDAYNNREASIHIQDPEGQGQASESALYDAFKRSYASWYDLAGNTRQATWLRGEEFSGVENDPRLKLFLLRMLGLPEHSQFVVMPEIEEAIFSEKVFRERSFNQLRYPVEREPVHDRLIRFPDGTAIMIE